MILFNYNIALSQDIKYYTSGNGYDYEIAIAMKAFNCIEKQCIAGLERTKFIDEKTQYTPDIFGEYLDTIQHYLYIRNHNRSYDFRFDGNISSLNFYRTYYYENSEREIFQIQLSLVYDRGLLKLNKVDITDKDMVLTPKDYLKYKYDDQTGSNTNIPFPPPPLFQNDIRIDYYTNINLCPDCQEKKLFTVDKGRNFLLREKHKYQSIEFLGEGYLSVKRNDLYGVVNNDNKMIIPIEYDRLEIKSGQSPSSMYVIAQKDSLYEIYNLKGKPIFPTEYEDVRIRLVFRGKNIYTRFILKKNNLYGVKDLKGNDLLPFEYQEIKLYYSRFFIVKKEDLFGIISVDGKVLIPPQYKELKVDIRNPIYPIEVMDEKNVKSIISIAKKNEKYEKIEIEENGN